MTTGTDCEFDLSAGFQSEFEILDRLGSGGMAVVFRAKQKRLNRIVAIKFLSACDAESRARFVREARSLGDLEHPHVVRLYDASVDGETPYIVMELVEGGTLRDLVRQGPIEVPKLLKLARETAEALAYLHGKGIVHRDLKPANILVAKDGTSKVADFGLARFVKAGQTLTTEGLMVGTPHFLAPEILKFQKASSASDIYAMGVLMYQGLTGDFPFPQSEMRALLVAHLEHPPPDVSLVQPAAGPDLSELIQRMMAKDPAARPKDGAALLEELAKLAGRPRRANSGALSRSGVLPRSGRVLRPGPTSAPPAPPASFASRLGSTWSALSVGARAGAALGAFVGLGLVGALGVRIAGRAEPSESPPPATVLASAPASASPSSVAPSPRSTALTDLLAEPITIGIPGRRKLPLNPVRTLAALPAEELATMQDLSEQLRQSTFSSSMSIFIPTNPLSVEVGLVEPPGGVARFQLDLFRAAHPSVAIHIARRDGTRVAMTASPNRRRYTAEAVPAHRGLNALYLLFVQPEGTLEPLYIESLVVQPRPPGFASPSPPPAAPPLSAPLAAQLTLAEAASDGNKWNEVVRLTEPLVKQAPELARAWHLRGDAMRRLKIHEHRHGIEALSEAVRKGPAEPWVWHDLGCAFFTGKWYPEAQAFLAFAARLAPDQYWMWYDLATVCQRRARPELALAYLDTAESCDPKQAGMVGRLRAEILLERRDRAGAITALARALARDPADEDTRRMLARVQQAP